MVLRHRGLWRMSLSKSQLRCYQSLDFVINRFLMRLSNKNNMEIMRPKCCEDAMCFNLSSITFASPTVNFGEKKQLDQCATANSLVKCVLHNVNVPCLFITPAPVTSRIKLCKFDRDLWPFSILVFRQSAQPDPSCIKKYRLASQQTAHPCISERVRGSAQAVLSEDTG